MITNRDLKSIARRIVALYNPDLIYLFGSYAKATISARSDVDLLVVKLTSLPGPLRGRDAAAHLAEFAVDIDLVFVTPAELQSEGSNPRSFLGTIMPTARLLYHRHPTPMFYCDTL